jgi:hypothetical protein
MMQQDPFTRTPLFGTLRGGLATSAKDRNLQTTYLVSEMKICLSALWGRSVPNLFESKDGWEEEDNLRGV